MIRVVTRCLALSFALTSFCSYASAVEPWSLQVSAERTEQSFETEQDDIDASIDSLTLSPGYEVGNWQITMTLAWQSIDGSYFFNNLYPNLELTCNQINSLSNWQKYWLVKNTQLSRDDLQYCANTGGVESDTLEDSFSGWNDIELFANYYLPINSEWLLGSVGIGYQHDNGDVEEGLGNGAKQVFGETSWIAVRGKFSLSMTLGYYVVLQDSSSRSLKDHGYGSLDGRWQPVDALELGVAYFYQQTDNDVFDDYDYLTYSVHYYLDRHWSGRLYASDYKNEPGLPDREYGLSLAYSF